MFSERSGSSSHLIYFILLLVAEIFGLVAVIIIGVLFDSKNSSPGYDWVKAPFSFHPFMMTLGLLFCYGNAIISYRTLRSVPKLTVKLIHASLLLLSLVFAAVGFIAIVRVKNTYKKHHFMSFHALLGLITLILFVLQWAAGFISFLAPKLSFEIRQQYMPSHRFWGRAIFIFALGTILMGLTMEGNWGADPTKPNRLSYIFFGLSVVIFGVIVNFLLGNTEYQRPPDESSDA